MVIIYFIFVFIIAIMFLGNLLTSIFIESFGFTMNYWISSNKLQYIQNKIKLELQDCANILYPNKYFVSAEFPVLHSTKTQDVDQFLQIR